jgi:hypothetical protein
MGSRLLDEVGAWLGRNHVRIAIAVFVAAVLCMFAFLGGCTTITMVVGNKDNIKDTAPDSSVKVDTEIEAQAKGSATVAPPKPPAHPIINRAITKEQPK